MKFSQELNEPAFKPREIIAGKEAQTRAEDLLAMPQEEFSAAFHKFADEAGAVEAHYTGSSPASRRPMRSSKPVASHDRLRFDSETGTRICAATNCSIAS